MIVAVLYRLSIKSLKLTCDNHFNVMSPAVNVLCIKYGRWREKKSIVRGWLQLGVNMR